MKKIFTLSVLLMAFILGVNAQEKKGWLFNEGLSDETIANLNADTDHWADNGHDADGNVNNWKNTVKQSADGYWMANGEVIEELRGLKIDIGSNKDNSVHLATTKLRLTRKNTVITFPKLANGQKITIQGRSANSTATNRGIAPVQSYIQFQAEESSPQTNGACIFLGNQAEGSEGTYTFVWKVVTDETDSVDVQFKLTPDAGIDFTYFMIDQGDAPSVEDAQPVAYLYNGTTGSLDDDYAYIYLAGAADKFALTEINVAETTADTDSLRKFMAVVVSPTIGPDDAYLPVIKQTIAFVPMLNFNPNLYNAWGYGFAEKTEQNLLKVLDPANPIFEGLGVEEGEHVLELLTSGGATGVQFGSQEYFAGDQTLAILPYDDENGVPAIHIHNAKRNAYLLLPLTLDVMPMANQDVIATLIPQALSTVLATKKDITAVSTPVISAKQLNGKTMVSISASNSKHIYYTNDGTDPTVESTLYTEPFTLTEPTTVKAFATGDGYTDSKIAEKAIVIMVQAAKPELTVSREQGKRTITLTAAGEGVNAYISFNGVSTSADMQLYTEPIVLNEPATLTAIAEGGDFLPSDALTQFIGIDGIDKTNVRLDTLSHFDANQTDWFINDPEASGEATPKASAYYFWGKSAWNYYSDEVDHEEIVKDSEGNDSIVYYYKPNADALKVIEPLNPNGWVLKSKGQVITGELQLSWENAVGNGRANRYAEEATDFITTPTKGAFTFGGKSSGDPYTASIESSSKLKGPFDVIVFCGNGNGSGYGIMEVQTSADGETWTKIDTLKMAKTQRYIKRTRLSYEGTDEVYVRVTQTAGGTKAQVYDILVMNNGELSQQYAEEAAGISDAPRLNDKEQMINGNAVYDLQGRRIVNPELRRGLYIKNGRKYIIK